MQAKNSYQVSPIGIIHSCFKQKFGIPRQPRLVEEVTATLEMLPPCNRSETLEGLQAFSHIWLVFVFHALEPGVWHPTVRPPRLGGNQRVGVFASRSMFRPNPIGMSAVELTHIDTTGKSPVLHLRGIDLLDGTPVIDIKPYIPYADRIDNARSSYANSAPEKKLQVQFSARASEQLAARQAQHPQLKPMIQHLLALDPRPAYQQEKPTSDSFGMRLYDFDVKWTVQDKVVLVDAII